MSRAAFPRSTGAGDEPRTGGASVRIASAAAMPQKQSAGTTVPAHAPASTNGVRRCAAATRVRHSAGDSERDSIARPCVQHPDGGARSRRRDQLAEAPHRALDGEAALRRVDPAQRGRQVTVRRALREASPLRPRRARHGDRQPRLSGAGAIDVGAIRVDHGDRHGCGHDGREHDARDHPTDVTRRRTRSRVNVR